jgi:hypothetical protein
MLTTDQKGAIAELAIAKAATELGIDVYRPFADGGRYDVIFDLLDRLVRVQCKWAPRHGEVIIVRCYSTRRSREGLLLRTYADGEVDAFAAYCPDTHVVTSFHTTPFRVGRRFSCGSPAHGTTNV